jgi:hypothetical protein
MQTLRKLLFALLVLSCTAQSLASVALACPDTADNGGMDPSAHAGHHMTPASEDSEDSSCCDGGLCTMSQCHPSPALPSAPPLHGQHHASAYPGASASSPPLHPRYALFKPPIFS